MILDILRFTYFPSRQTPRNRLYHVYCSGGLLPSMSHIYTRRWRWVLENWNLVALKVLEFCWGHVVGTLSLTDSLSDWRLTDSLPEDWLTHCLKTDRLTEDWLTESRTNSLRVSLQSVSQSSVSPSVLRQWVSQSSVTESVFSQWVSQTRLITDWHEDWRTQWLKTDWRLIHSLTDWRLMDSLKIDWITD